MEWFNWVYCGMHLVIEAETVWEAQTASGCLQSHRAGDHRPRPGGHPVMGDSGRMTGIGRLRSSGDLTEMT
jgi:hypothetical protein